MTLFLSVKPEKRLFIFSILFWGSFFTLLWPHCFRSTAQGIEGHAVLWGDWAWHVTLANYLASQPFLKAFATHPVVLGFRLDYPFVVDFVSALILRLGGSLPFAFVLPSILASWLFVYVLHRFIWDATRSDRATVIAVFLFFSSGGLGFLYFFWDQVRQFDWSGFYFPRQFYTSIPQDHIQWLSPVAFEFIPQRTFLVGLPLTLLIISTLCRWQKKDFENVSIGKMVCLGFFSGCLISIHAHSFLCLIIFCGVLFLLRPRLIYSWFWYALGALGPSLFIFAELHSSNHATGFLRIHLGWMSEGRWFLFWWLNWGCFLPLAILGIVRRRLLDHPVVITGLVLFILANVIQFQPWIWDNSKLLTYSYLFLSVPVALYLEPFMAEKRLLARTCASLVLVATSLTGCLDLARLAHADALSQVMWTKEEIAMAEELKKKTPSTSLILTGNFHLHWVPCLTGRRIVLGFPGWLFSYGFETGALENDVRRIYSGNRTDELIRKYGIDAVVIGPDEKKDFAPDEAYFSSRYPLLMKTADTRVYQTSRQ